MKGFNILTKFLVGGLILVSNNNLFASQKDYIEKVTKVYENVIPEAVNVQIKTTLGQPKYIDYIYVKSVEAPIREEATTKSNTVGKYPFNTKLQVLEKVESKAGTTWYKVRTEDGKVGYISERLAELRVFRFDEMLNRIKTLEKFVKEEHSKGRELVSTNTYVPNPNNVNFKREKDKYGTSLDQNTMGYYGNENIIVPDRSIMSIVSQNGGMTAVNVASIKEKPINIKSSAISRSPRVNPNFAKVVVIDIANQNQGVFEKINGAWKLISYVYSKTGMESQVGFETPRGYFIVPMLKYEMGYRSEVGENQGYAKYAIRFSGGGYLHGTPINFEEEINREFFLKQKEGTLGTVPGTRKCIRNNEDYAKFLFDWMTEGKVNPNQNEQVPAENVMFIIF